MTFDASQRYRISPAVTLRPEPFGALAYDFRKRLLTYLAAADLALTDADLKTLDQASTPYLIYPHWHQANLAVDRLSEADRVLLEPHFTPAR